MGLSRAPAAALRSLGLAVWLLGRAARGAAADVRWSDDLSRRRLSQALAVFLWRPLPVLALLAALTGYIVGVSVGQLLSHFRAEAAIEPMVATVVCRDLLPLLIGVFGSGRIAVALAARLGAMRMQRELDALETLGIDPARYVLAPAFAAVTIAVPVHLLVAAGLAWVCGGVALQANAATPWPQFLQLTLTPATGAALITGLAKSLVFAATAACVGAVVGARDMGGAPGLADQATRAFTAGLIGVFIAAAAWAGLS